MAMSVVPEVSIEAAAQDQISLGFRRMVLTNSCKVGPNQLQME